jgi:hypothetical protein
LLAAPPRSLQQRDAKLADAQQAQADVVRKQRDLDDAKREIDLTIQNRVQAELTAVRDKAKQETEAALNRIEAVVERFTEMQADLDRERKAMTRLWAKREEQIHGVVETMAGLYGDLQGIAGRSFQEIVGLEVPLLNGPAASEAAE